MSVCTALISSYPFEVFALENLQFYTFLHPFEVSALENLQLYTSNVQSRASNPEEKKFLILWIKCISSQASGTPYRLFLLHLYTP
jgi:hypothetical protein